MTPLIRSIIKSTFEAGFDPTEVHWFDISAVKHMDESRAEWLKDHRPPFQKCMVVWAGETTNNPYYELIMAIAGDDPEQGIVINLQKGSPGSISQFPPIVYAIDDGQLRYGPVLEGDKVSVEVANSILAFVSKWYEMMDTGLACHRASVKQSFTNRRKVAQGKLPAYDWTTVVVKRSAPKSDHQGGTHASPRQHDRRGHLRRLQSGRNVWVRPCKVGDPSKGIVFHDYEVRNETL